MYKPLISVIVPIYNVERFLDECITSIVRQTYENLEIILVDDGSPDSCPKKCDEWACKDSRIRVIHKSNGGLSDARNVGIEESNGEYLMFVDSDDFIAPEMVNTLYKLITDTNADVACGGIYKYKNGNSSPIYNEIILSQKEVFEGIEQLRNILRLKTDCSAWGKLYKRNVVGEYRFIKGRYNEDIIFLFALYQICGTVAYTSQRLYYYRDTEGSITGTVSKRTMDALVNAFEMEAMTKSRNLPVQPEMENYKCRICLEIGYRIQKAKLQHQFTDEAKLTKEYTKRYFYYILRSKDYNWRDLVHALINIVKL